MMSNQQNYIEYKFIFSQNPINQNEQHYKPNYKNSIQNGQRRPFWSWIPGKPYVKL